METILAGILMVLPAMFFFLILAGGIIMTSMWIYAHLPNSKPRKKQRLERRSGIDRRHTVMQ